MKSLLWIGKAPGDGRAGDEVYDRQMLAALRRLGYDIERIHPARVGRLQQAANLASGMPHHRARYFSEANLRRLTAAAGRHRAAICSWEPFDLLAARLKGPVLPILHNVTSTALPAMFPHHPLAAYLAVRAAAWEREAYAAGARFPALVVLSEADAAHLRRSHPGMNVIHAPPGLPPLQPLPASAVFHPELLLSGTFDWRPKRRDVLRFAQDYAGAGRPWPVHADRLPPEAEALLQARPLAGLQPDMLRLGLSTDRFVAGYKLKLGAYIAANAPIASFADLSAEFAGIDGYEDFVFTVADIPDLHRVVKALSSRPADRLRRDWFAFRQACAAAFSWQGSAERIAAALEAL